ncbi:hypothetical protein BDV32DRAFT_130528 [Aspergillus pseudonomiae]|nr:hypothetical protein BDV32DRAFT_130528 [Aspergillus pseudonomiae]
MLLLTFSFLYYLPPAVYVGNISQLVPPQLTTSPMALANQIGSFIMGDAQGFGGPRPDGSAFLDRALSV